jgi:hypothetical protein
MTAKVTAALLVAFALATLAGLGMSPWILGSSVGVGPFGAQECVLDICQSGSLPGLLAFLGYSTAGFAIVVAVLAIRAALDLLTRSEPRTPSAALLAWVAVAIAAIVLFCWRMASVVHGKIALGYGVAVAAVGLIGTAVVYQLHARRRAAAT